MIKLLTRSAGWFAAGLTIACGGIALGAWQASGLDLTQPQVVTVILHPDHPAHLQMWGWQPLAGTQDGRWWRWPPVERPPCPDALQGDGRGPDVAQAPAGGER